MTLMDKIKAAPKKNLILGLTCLAASIAVFVFFFVCNHL